MANISPRPSPENEEQATGDGWVHSAMGTLNTLLQVHSDLFRFDFPIYGVLVQAIYQVEQELREQVSIVENQ